MVNYDKLYENTRFLRNKVLVLGNEQKSRAYSAVYVYDVTARAFGDKAVQSISYGCILNEPFGINGVFTLYRDGRMIIQTREGFEKYGVPE